MTHDSFDYRPDPTIGRLLRDHLGVEDHDAFVTRVRDAARQGGLRGRPGSLPEWELLARWFPAPRLVRGRGGRGQHRQPMARPQVLGTRRKAHPSACGGHAEPKASAATVAARQRAGHLRAPAARIGLGVAGDEPTDRFAGARRKPGDRGPARSRPADQVCGVAEAIRRAATARAADATTPSAGLSRSAILPAGTLRAAGRSLAGGARRGILAPLCRRSTLLLWGAPAISLWRPRARPAT